MTIAHVASAGASSTTDNTVNTTGIDTSGATLIIIAHGDFDQRATVSDNKGNTFTHLTAQTVATNRGVQLHYCASPTVGTNHIVTATVITGYPAIGLMSYSGVKLISPFDVENGAVVSGLQTDIQTGSITPSEDNELVITAVCSAGTLVSDPSGYTNRVSQAPTAHSVALFVADKIQGTAGAENPNWTTSQSSNLTAAIASFKAAVVVADNLWSQSFM